MKRSADCCGRRRATPEGLYRSASLATRGSTRSRSSAAIQDKTSIRRQRVTMKNREQSALREQIGAAVQVDDTFCLPKSFELQVKYHSVRCLLKVGILVALKSVNLTSTF